MKAGTQQNGSSEAVTNEQILDALGKLAVQLREDMRADTKKLEERYTTRANSIKSMFTKAMFQTNRIYDEQRRQKIALDAHEVELMRLQTMMGDANDLIEAHDDRLAELERNSMTVLRSGEAPVVMSEEETNDEEPEES